MTDYAREAAVKIFFCSTEEKVPIIQSAIDAATADLRADHAKLMGVVQEYITAPGQLRGEAFRDLAGTYDWLKGKRKLDELSGWAMCYEREKQRADEKDAEIERLKRESETWRTASSYWYVEFWRGNPPRPNSSDPAIDAELQGVVDWKKQAATLTAHLAACRDALEGCATELENTSATAEKHRDEKDEEDSDEEQYRNYWFHQGTHLGYSNSAAKVRAVLTTLAALPKEKP